MARCDQSSQERLRESSGEDQHLRCCDGLEMELIQTRKHCSRCKAHARFVSIGFGKENFMTQKKWMIGLFLAIPLTVGGLVLAHANARANDQRKSSETFICPLTGKELPCSKCCPLTKRQQKPVRSCCSTKDNQASKESSPFICPVTGEEFPCSKCCPLKKEK